MMRSITVIAVFLLLNPLLPVVAAFLSMNQQAAYRLSGLPATEMCPEVPLTPRPGNEIAVVALG